MISEITLLSSIRMRLECISEAPLRSKESYDVIDKVERKLYILYRGITGREMHRDGLLVRAHCRRESIQK